MAYFGKYINLLNEEINNDDFIGKVFKIINLKLRNAFGNDKISSTFLIQGIIENGTVFKTKDRYGRINYILISEFKNALENNDIKEIYFTELL